MAGERMGGSREQIQRAFPGLMTAADHELSSQSGLLPSLAEHTALAWHSEVPG